MNSFNKPYKDLIYWLSIGTLYHRITLSDDRSQIHIMKFQPKPSKPSKPSMMAPDKRINYKYRFQVGCCVLKEKFVFITDDLF